jgi:tRNA-splicing ligase RtcB
VSWKASARRDPAGFYTYRSERGEARIFMGEALFAELEESLGPQIENARRFPGVLDVVITPDAHHGYGVPVGCVIATSGTLAMGPVGYDIGCGMAALCSSVSQDQATPERVKDFSRRVMQRVGLGAGSRGQTQSDARFQEIVRGGALALGEKRGTAERDRIPVDDTWDIPKDSRAWRGQNQLGSLGGGNHFIELQSDGERLWVMFHTGSRGFGHGLAEYFFAVASEELGLKKGEMDLGYFEPESRHWRSYKNAVAAGGNYAIANRLLIGREVAKAFDETFGEAPELGLRDQPQPGAGGAPPRPVPPAGVDPQEGRYARAAGRPPAARRHALADDRPPRADPGLDGRHVVRAAAAAGRRPLALLREPRLRPPHRRARPRAVRSRSRPRTSACASWACW